MDRDAKLLVSVSLQVSGLSVLYAGGLSWLERQFPLIKPDHIWAEVAGGVLITLVPVALTARRLTSQPDSNLSWRDYEAAVWCAFGASGVPIILWQLGETLVRRAELLQYAAYRLPDREDEEDTEYLSLHGKVHILKQYLLSIAG